LGWENLSASLSSPVMRGLCLLLAAAAPTALVVPLAGSRTPAVSHRVPTQAVCSETRKGIFRDGAPECC